MFVVTVTFRTRPGQLKAFMAEMRAQARNSLEREPGCHQFDVCLPEGAEDEVFLYEIYEDRAAFEAHLASDHYRAFDVAVTDLVSEKSVRLMERDRQ